MSFPVTSIGLRGGRDGPFFFGRIAILCLAAEWLNRIIGSRVTFRSSSSFEPISYDDLLCDKKPVPESMESSPNISELDMLSRPNEL